MAPPPALRNKGRYVLLALALAGAWAAWHPDPAPAAAPPDLVPVSASAEAPATPCLGPAPAAAPAPTPPQALSGRLGLWVAEIDPATLRPLRAVAQVPDGVFPLASTYKQAVLWAVLREVDAGRLSPGERFNVTPASQSLGDYPYDGSNVRDLTERMIRHSDNTATDLLHRRVGLGAVQALADDLGLCRTRLILPTKAWWTAQTGSSPAFLAGTGWDKATGTERARLATAIDADAQRLRADVLQNRLNIYFDGTPDPAEDLRVHNLSTPYEFATLLAHQHLRSGLSPDSLAWQREVAAMGYGRSALPPAVVGKVTTFAGKGGNGWRLLTYSGYLRTEDGRHVVYAFMQHGADQTYTMPNTRHAFAWIGAGLRAVLEEP
ncbi:serine hydrolase [Deinococcus sp. SDU3-2]|uniref:Serine hydrolase n=1 Tax=Deinococcus terrestris TaxID=2651870 RepID=A0A7X1NTH7_9DEIO|nr:serine hydrolase [Deinococcus terrestris]MPY65483.1 serine hydrolase [Deinococcus terrestris]